MSDDRANGFNTRIDFRPGSYCGEAAKEREAREKREAKCEHDFPKNPGFGHSERCRKGCGALP